MRRAARIAALAIAALAAVAPARADDLQPWFAGASGGRSASKYERIFTPKGTGPTFAIEGGKFLAPALAVSLFVRLDLHSDYYRADSIGGGGPTYYDAEIRELAFGPRFYLAPWRGRVRIGAGIGKLITRHRLRPNDGSKISTERMLATFEELYVGVTPFRIGRLDVEIGGTFGRTEELHFFWTKTWHAFGVGLRWHTQRTMH